MISAACPHCRNRSFALQEIEPAGSKVKFNLVTCEKCGAPFGAVEYYSLGTLLRNQERAIDDILRRVRSIEDNVERLRRASRS